MIPHKRQSLEEKFHMQVATYLAMALPVDAFFTTIPTVGSSRFQGAKLKAKGYAKGTPDILILWRSCNWWLELKSPIGVVSDDQRAVHGRIAKAGGCVGLAKTLEHVEMWLTQWGIPLRARLSEPPSVKAARETA